MFKDSNREIFATPKARTIAGEHGIDLLQIAPSGKYGEIVAADVIHAISKAKVATPLALRIAQDKRIDLSSVRGSGHAGKVFSFDLPSFKQAAAGMFRRIRLTNIRKVIASRMLSSHTEIPPVTQNTEVDVTLFMQFRRQLNEHLPREKHISVNDLILKAVAIALSQNERLRYQYIDDEYLMYDDINIGMAVSIDDGLVVPVLRQVDRQSVSEIAAETKRLAAAARGKGLSPDDFKGGVITVSNLGMYGVHSFTPIINQPEAAILGVCAPSDRLMLDKTGITMHSFMMLSLTYDHRIINGAEAAAFTNCIKHLLENPTQLLDQE